MTGFPRPGRRRRRGRAGTRAGRRVARVAAAPPAPGGWAQFSIGSQKPRTRTRRSCSRPTRSNTTTSSALTVAKGHVEISQGGEVLLADVVSYNQRTDTITASGHVSLLMPTGEVVFADFMELRDSMNNGFAQNVRMLLADRSRLAGQRRAAAQRQPHGAAPRRLFAVRPVQGQPERAARLAVQGARNHRRQGTEADRVPRRGPGGRRLAGILHALSFRSPTRR